MGIQRRRHFRIVYPLTDCPIVTLWGKDYRVLNISEGGIKFRAKYTRDFIEDELLELTIKFHDDESFELRGTIIRRDRDGVAVRLKDPLPLAKIRSEELRLIRTYVGYVPRESERLSEDQAENENK